MITPTGGIQKKKDNKISESEQEKPPSLCKKKKKCYLSPEIPSPSSQHIW